MTVHDRGGTVPTKSAHTAVSFSVSLGAFEVPPNDSRPASKHVDARLVSLVSFVIRPFAGCKEGGQREVPTFGEGCVCRLHNPQPNGQGRPREEATLLTSPVHLCLQVDLDDPIESLPRRTQHRSVTRSAVGGRLQ